MTTPAVALAELLDAVKTVDGLTGYRGDQIGQMRLPAVVVGLPRLFWESYCTDPNRAAYPIAVLVPMDSRAMGLLLDYVAPVQAAVEALTGVTITDATPIAHDLGNGGTAAGYELTVEFPL